MRLPAWLVRLPLVASLLLAHVRCENVFGIMGENFTFPVKIVQKPVEILWTKNKNKVAEWEGQTKTTYFPSLRNRGLLNKEDGGLTIFNLEYDDAGIYVLKYLDSVNKNYNSTFILAVLAPPSQPEISCNVSGGRPVLKCTANFKKPLTYTWKFSSSPATSHSQEVPVPEDVDASEKATCFIKVSQTEKSSEISLTQCFPGDSYHKRSRGGLIAAFVLFIPVVGIGGFIYKNGRTKSETRHAAQRNSPVHDSGEHQPLRSANSQEQLNSETAATQGAEDGSKKDLRNSPSCVEEANSSQFADSENERTEADQKSNTASTMIEGEMVNDGVQQEGRTKSETRHAAQRNSPVHDSGEHQPLRSANSQEQLNSETAATQGAEDGSKKDLRNSPSCVEEDIIS